MAGTTTHKVEAKHYVPAEWDQVSCRLCPHLCVIAPSRRGLCGVRFNRNGVLYTDNYARVTTLDLIASESLPLYHFKPGAKWLRAGSKGCNLRCPFCTTYQFSQSGAVRSEFLQPTELVERAIAEGAVGIAFGVNEPLVSFEYMLDTFREARRRKLHTHFETNGSWTEDPLHEIIEHTTAISVGFKEFDERFITGECGGELDNIRQTVRVAHGRGVHVECSYLVIEHNPKWQVRAARFAGWLSGIEPSIPCTLRALKSAFMWEGLSSSSNAVIEAHKLMRGTLRNLYIAEAAHNNTTCSCGHILVSRDSTIKVEVAPNGKCPSCGARSGIKC